MKKLHYRRFCAAMLTVLLAVALCTPAAALFEKPASPVEFIFTQKNVTFARNMNGSAKQQTPNATPYWSGLATDVTGYTITYRRTHTGDGKLLKTPDKPVAAPSQAGTYTAIITFSDDVKFVNQNGSKVQEYPKTFVIEKAEQPPAILRSAAAALTENPDHSGGSINPGGQGVISTRWASGTTPIYMWTKGSGTVVEPEAGKPARFKALSAGEAVLSVRLPADNNYHKSEAVTYTVKVNGEVNTGEGYVLRGEKKNDSGWFVSDVEVHAQNGFAEAIVAEDTPITAEGESIINVALKTADGKMTQTEAVTVKKDSEPPSIETIMLNDSPWSDAPMSESAWAAAVSLVISAQIRDDVSGIAKVEYSVDGAEYTSDANAVFTAQGIKTFPYSHVMETKGEHTLSLRATDWAGNMSEQMIHITAPTPKPSASVPPASSQGVSSVPPQSAPTGQEAIAPDAPTDAMKAVSARLAYLRRCNIEARVAGDVRANKGYIEETLTMFTNLSAGERKGLGEETLAGLRAYFEALYAQNGKDVAELEALFVFIEAPPASSVPEQTSAAQQKEESIPQPSSVSKPDESESASASASASSSSVSLVPAGQSGGNPFFIVIPALVLAVAFVVYLIWQKRTIAPAPDTKAGQAPPASQEDFTGYGNFDDFE